MKTAPDLPNLGARSQPTYYKATLMVSAIRKERENCPPLPYTKKCNKCQDMWVVAYKQNSLLCACNYFSIAGKSFHNPNVYIPYGLRRLLRLQIPTQTQKTKPTDQTLQSTPAKNNPHLHEETQKTMKKKKPQKLYSNV
jgi:hypothetical protein